MAVPLHADRSRTQIAELLTKPFVRSGGGARRPMAGFGQGGPGGSAAWGGQGVRPMWEREEEERMRRGGSDWDRPSQQSSIP